MLRQLALLTLINYTVISHQRPHSLPNGRLITWDGQGLMPLDTEAPLTPEQELGIQDLAQWNLAKAMRGALLRMQRDPNDYVSGWIYAQAARLRKTETNALNELRIAAEKQPDNLNIPYTLGTIDSQIWTEFYFETTGSRSKQEYTRAYFEMTKIQEQVKAKISADTLASGKISIGLLIFLTTSSFFGPRYSERELVRDYAKAHPDFLPTQIYLTQCFMRPDVLANGKDDDAHSYTQSEAMLKEIAARNPDYGLPYFFLADIQVRRLNGYKAASPLFKKFLSMPNPPECYRIMAENYVRTGDAMAIRTKFPP